MPRADTGQSEIHLTSMVSIEDSRNSLKVEEIGLKEELEPLKANHDYLFAKTVTLMFASTV